MRYSPPCLCVRHSDQLSVQTDNSSAAWKIWGMNSRTPLQMHRHSSSRRIILYSYILSTRDDKQYP